MGVRTLPGIDGSVARRRKFLFAPGSVNYLKFLTVLRGSQSVAWPQTRRSCAVEHAGRQHRDVLSPVAW